MVQGNRTACQSRIIESARRIIFSKGIESLTTREIAKDLRLTNGSLYRHFKNKKEIISILIDDIEETLLTTIKRAADIKKGPLEKLENIFLSHISYAQRMKGTSFVIINEVVAIKDKYLQKKMLKVIDGYLETIRRIIEQGVKTRVFKKETNPSAASIVFFGSIQSMVTLWSLSGYKRPLTKGHFIQTFNVCKNWLRANEEVYDA